MEEDFGYSLRLFIKPNDLELVKSTLTKFNNIREGKLEGLLIFELTPSNYEKTINVVRNILNQCKLEYKIDIYVSLVTDYDNGGTKFPFYISKISHEFKAPIQFSFVFVM